MMKGLTPSSLKKHPSLVPLFVTVGTGMVFASLYLVRLGVRCPDIGWMSKKTDIANVRWPEHDQYKFYAPVRDYSKLKDENQRPKF